MIIKALFFAHLQDIVGGRERTISLTQDATVVTAVQELGRQYPAMADLLAHVRVAVNAEFAEAETALRDGDEVAFMPPMSGGV